MADEDDYQTRRRRVREEQADEDPFTPGSDFLDVPGGFFHRSGVYFVVMSDQPDSDDDEPIRDQWGQEWA